MLPTERGVADGGYQDTRYFMMPLRVNALIRSQIDPVVLAAYHEAAQHVRGRQEHINAELKEWSVLTKMFRHNPAFHSVCFQAVAQLTQLRLELQPSILTPPQFIPVLNGAGLTILQLNQDGVVVNSRQL